MTPLDVLVAARDLVARPGGWCQGQSARGADGAAVYLGRTPAAKHCALGACYVSCGGMPAQFSEAVKLLNKAAGDHVIAWNDRPTRTQAEVVAAFDRAIAAAEGAA
jgi:hypothetical protein